MTRQHLAAAVVVISLVLHLGLAMSRLQSNEATWYACCYNISLQFTICKRVPGKNPRHLKSNTSATGYEWWSVAFQMSGTFTSWPHENHSYPNKQFLRASSHGLVNCHINSLFYVISVISSVLSSRGQLFLLKGRAIIPIKHIIKCEIGYGSILSFTF